MHSARNLLALAGWLAITFTASLTGALVSTRGWYADLIKPSWNPPSWVFGPVWTTLYAMMAVAAWLVWMRGGWKTRKFALGCYLLQLSFNALWTPIFFGLQRPGLAFVEITLLDAAVVVTLVSFWRARWTAGLLLAPYLFWLLFATFLNFTIWQLNSPS